MGLWDCTYPPTKGSLHSFAQSLYLPYGTLGLSGSSLFILILEGSSKFLTVNPHWRVVSNVANKTQSLQCAWDLTHPPKLASYQPHSFPCMQNSQRTTNTLASQNTELIRTNKTNNSIIPLRLVLSSKKRPWLSLARSAIYFASLLTRLQHCAQRFEHHDWKVKNRAFVLALTDISLLLCRIEKNKKSGCQPQTSLAQHSQPPRPLSHPILPSPPS